MDTNGSLLNGSKNFSQDILDVVKGWPFYCDTVITDGCLKTGDMVT